MRKLILLFISTSLTCLFLMGSNIWATPYVETWQSDARYASGYGQYMETGDWVSLGFDFEYDAQDVSYSDSMKENGDVDTTIFQSENENTAGSHPDWSAGQIDLMFWTGDSATESAEFALTVWSDGSTFDLGDFTISSEDFDVGGGYWWISLVLDQTTLEKFSKISTGTFRVDATTGNFLLTAVSMSLEPVPEPATIMLFGIGLLGLAGVSRRKK